MEGVLKTIQERIQTSIKRKGGGAKYFATARRGEAAELHADLSSTDVSRQKSAVKRVIANMTMGKDVSLLFVDIVKLGQTTNLELKKLVYLYILNTAKLLPEKAILAVNTFLHDAQSTSPIVRALAIRSMMCIRVDAVIEYTLEPLRHKANDEDPYVRKTVAVGLGKLFHHDTTIFYEQNFLDELLRLLSDGNAMVVSNAAAVLSEVIDYGGRKDAVKLPEGIMSKLLLVLGETTEWGQQYILELLASLKPADGAEALEVAERVMPRLNHTNPAVVMAAVKVIANIANRCRPEAIDRFTNRINPALLTLAKADPETQYITCKNIHALLVIFPNLLCNNLDAFYVRFNDPTYVKLEKLKLLLKLVTPSTATGIVNELAEYSTEVDPLFVEAVVSAIASLAIKVESASMQCAELLMRIVERKPELLPYVTTAAKNIVHCYPDLLLLEPLIAQYGADTVVDEDAKVSLVWMLGEYCDFIENGPEIIQRFIDALHTHEQSVQLCVLTAVVKMFLRDPAKMEATLHAVLEGVMSRSVDPDLRDRAFAYWRLLSKGMSVDAMKSIVYGDGADAAAPVCMDHTFSDAMTMGDLKKSINTAAVVFGQPYQSFLAPYGLTDLDGLDDEEEENSRGAPSDDDDIDVPGSGSQPNSPYSSGGASGAAATTAAAALPSPAHGNAAAPAASLSSAMVPPAKRVDPLESIFGGGQSTSLPAPQQQPAPPFSATSQPAPVPSAYPAPRTDLDDLFS